MDTHEDFVSIRVDHQLSERQSLFGRVMVDKARSSQPDTLPPFESLVTSRNVFATLEQKYILSPRTLNVARVAFNRTDPFLQDHVDLQGDDARAGRTWSITSQVSAFSDIGHLNLRAGASNNPILGTVEHWYDPRAFELPVAGVYGNLGRNTLIGPDLINVNMSIVKTFQPHEGQTVGFRSEFFNLFNRANFGLPNRFPFLADGSYSGSAGPSRVSRRPRGRSSSD